jgi:glutamine cyclotransferase
MRTAGLMCLALATAACTTVDDTTASSLATTSTVVTLSTTTGADTSVSAESSLPTTTEAGAASVQEGHEILGGGTIKAVVESILPHDFNAQTQGLAWNGAGLIESIGPYGSSQRRFLSPTSARTSQPKNLAPELFATDLVVLDSTGIQLSAREGIATIFSLEDLKRSGRHRFEGDAWGICQSDETLVTSDNSGTLTLRNIDTFVPTGTAKVNEQFGELRALECTKGLVWAVLGDSGTIAAIELDSGDVKGVLDLSALVPSTAGPNDQLTAIAYNPASDTFFVAGRRWGVIYELSLEAPA